MDIFVKNPDLHTIVRGLMNLTDNVPNVVVWNDQRLEPFFTTANPLFLRHSISFIMSLMIKMASVAGN